MTMFGRFAAAPAMCVSRWWCAQLPQPSAISTLGKSAGNVSCRDNRPLSSSTASSKAVIDLVIEPMSRRSSTI